MARRRLVAQLVDPRDTAFLTLARDRFRQAEDADRQQRARELEDLQFYDGKQWPQEQIDARQGQPGNATNGLPPVPARPTLTIDKVREPVRVVLNSERQADLGVEIVAADDFGDGGGISAAEIRLREGLVRRIQRESQAADARSWAFQRATIAGRGYYRVMTRYVPGRTFDQDLYIDRIYNQASVSLDPSHEQPDGSDAEWGFIGTDLPWDRYLAEYGRVNDKPNVLTHASTTDFRALGDELPGWFTADGPTRAVRVVEYWYTERVPRTLVQLQDGSAVYEDEHDGTVPLGVDDQGDPIRREVIDTRIKWAKLDGVQVLEQTDWPGKYIPIVKVVGEEVQPYDGERRAVGMVRPARDPQRAYNAMVSKWVEQIGLAPVPPWMGPAGFDEGFETEYQLATTRTLPALHYNTTGLDGQPIPPPTRTSITMEIQAIAGSVQLFDQAIKSTTAVPDPTLGNVDPTLRSGKAIQQLLDQAQQGTSHFLDNLTRSIRYEGLILNDLLAAVYHRPGRLVRMMSPAGETEAVPLGGPAPPAPGTTPSGTPPVYTLTPGATFNVAVTVTKNYDTRRQQQESTLAALIQTEPQLMTVFGDLLFKYNDGPGHEELEERARVMLAPPVQALLKGQPAPDPEKAALQAQVQALQGALQTKQVEQVGKLQVAQLQEHAENARAAAANQTAIEKQEIAATATISVAQAKIDAENLRSYVDALESRLGKVLDLHMQKLEQLHEAVSQASAQAHDVGLAAMAQAHQRGLAAQTPQQALAPAAAPPVAAEDANA